MSFFQDEKTKEVKALINHLLSKYKLSRKIVKNNAYHFLDNSNSLSAELKEESANKDQVASRAIIASIVYLLKIGKFQPVNKREIRLCIELLEIWESIHLYMVDKKLISEADAAEEISRLNDRYRNLSLPESYYSKIIYSIKQKFNNFFPTPEAKSLIDLVRQFMQEHPSLGTKFIEDDTIKLILSSQEDIVRCLRVEKENPYYLVLKSMLHVIDHHLNYGGTYTLKGLLNFKGSEALKLSHIICKEMVKNGFATKEEVDNYHASLKEIIKNNG